MLETPDPVSGRFTRADTVENNTSGMDPYGYVGGNPETRNDPTGERYISDTGQLGPLGSSVSPTNGGGSKSGGSTPKPTHPSSHPHSSAPSVAQVTHALASVAGVAGKIRWEAIDLIFNFSGMWHDVETITDANASWLAKGVGDAVGCALSFSPNTPVSTDHGKQAIVTLQPGEKVWAYNTKTNKMELEPIVHVWINHDNDLVDLTITTFVHLPMSKESYLRRNVLSTHYVCSVIAILTMSVFGRIVRVIT